MRNLLSNILLALPTRCTDRDMREPHPGSNLGHNYAVMARNRQAADAWGASSIYFQTVKPT